MKDVDKIKTIDEFANSGFQEMHISKINEDPYNAQSPDFNTAQ